MAFADKAPAALGTVQPLISSRDSVRHFPSLTPSSPLSIQRGYKQGFRAGSLTCGCPFLLGSSSGCWKILVVGREHTNVLGILWEILTGLHSGISLGCSVQCYPPTAWPAAGSQQPEHLQFLAVAGVIPAITRDSSGSRLVAGLTPAPLSTMRGARTTSLGEACSFPPSCKRSRQPAKTCPRKGFPQHLLHRIVSTFRVNTAMPPPNFLPHHRAHFSPCLGAHYSGWDTCPKTGQAGNGAKMQHSFPSLNEDAVVMKGK